MLLLNLKIKKINVNHMLIQLVLFGVSFNATGQGLGYVDLDPVASDQMFLGNRYEPNDNNIEGTSLFNANWESGELVVMQGENRVKYKVDSMKYDMFRKMVFFQRENQVFIFPKTIRVVKFNLGTTLFVSVVDHESFENDYFEMLFEGTDVMLLKKYNCVIVKGKASNGIVEAIPDTYKTSILYYTKIKEQRVKKIKLRKDRFMELFPSKQEAIKEFIDKNKLKSKNEEDLVRIFEFINSEN